MQDEREYDLFERLPDGSPIWRGRAIGLNEVEAKLRRIAAATTNECFALHLATKEIVLRLNVSSSEPQAETTSC